MTGFPLFRLPLLPLKIVVDEICLSNLIRLHVCSKKSRDLLKAMKKSVSLDSLSQNQKDSLSILERLYLLRLETYINPGGLSRCFPENSYTTTITIDDSYSIKIKVGCEKQLPKNSKKYQFHFPFRFIVAGSIGVERNTDGSHNASFGTRDNFDFDGITVRVTIARNLIYTYWKDKSDGLNVLVNYFKKFFNAQTIEYIIKGSKKSFFSHNLRTVFKGMAQQTISSCEIHNSYMNDDDYKFILDNVNPTHSFKQENTFLSRSNDFQHNLSFKSEYFKLEPANWFTFENLITLDCKRICLFGSRLTNDDLKEYVKQWMTGKYSKLRFLNVELQENANVEYIFSELEHFSENSPFSRSQSDSKKYTIIRESDIICIKQQDKIVARILIPKECSSKKIVVFFHE